MERFLSGVRKWERETRREKNRKEKEKVIDIKEWIGGWEKRDIKLHKRNVEIYRYTNKERAKRDKEAYKDKKK